MVDGRSKRCVVSVHLPFHQSSHWRTQEKVKGSGIPIGWDGRGFGWLVWGQLWPFHLYSRRITITSLHDYGQTGQFWKPKPGKTHVCNFRKVLITAKPLAKSYKRRKRGTAPMPGRHMLSGPRSEKDCLLYGLATYKHYKHYKHIEHTITLWIMWIKNIENYPSDNRSHNVWRDIITKCWIYSPFKA